MVGRWHRRVVSLGNFTEKGLIIVGFTKVFPVKQFGKGYHEYCKLMPSELEMELIRN
jgi:hypothetical protein